MLVKSKDGITYISPRTKRVYDIGELKTIHEKPLSFDIAVIVDTQESSNTLFPFNIIDYIWGASILVNGHISDYKIGDEVKLYDDDILEYIAKVVSEYETKMEEKLKILEEKELFVRFDDFESFKDFINEKKKINVTSIDNFFGNFDSDNVSGYFWYRWGDTWYYVKDEDDALKLSTNCITP